MPQNGLTARNTPRLLPSKEELARCIDRQTHRQVRDLRINCRGERVQLEGRSNTYYTKQLATQAVQTMMPSVQLENEIFVAP